MTYYSWENSGKKSTFLFIYYNLEYDLLLLTLLLLLLLLLYFEATATIVFCPRSLFRNCLLCDTNKIAAKMVAIGIRRVDTSISNEKTA